MELMTAFKTLWVDIVGLKLIADTYTKKILNSFFLDTAHTEINIVNFKLYKHTL